MGSHLPFWQGGQSPADPAAESGGLQRIHPGYRTVGAAIQVECAELWRRLDTSSRLHTAGIAVVGDLVALEGHVETWHRARLTGQAGTLAQDLLPGKEAASDEDERAQENDEPLQQAPCPSFQSQFPLAGGFILPLCRGDSRPAGLHQRRQYFTVAQVGSVGTGQPALRFQQFDLVEQAAAAPAQPYPLGGLGLQPPSRLLRFAPLRQPFLKRRPASDERFVGDVHQGRRRTKDERRRLVIAGGRSLVLRLPSFVSHRRAAQRQQAVADQMLQDAIKFAGVIAGGAQGRYRLLAAGVGSPFAELDQAQEDAASQRLLIACEGSQGGVGAAGHGHLQPAERRRAVGAAGQRQGLVSPQRQEAAFHLLPEQHQRLLHQRQDARFVRRIGQQPLHQRRLHEHADVLRWPHDGLAQALFVQRKHLQAVGLDLGPEG